MLIQEVGREIIELCLIQGLRAGKLIRSYWIPPFQYRLRQRAMPSV